MPKTQFTSSWSVATDAEYRAAIAPLIAALDAVATRAATTGQINPTTATKPPTAGTTNAYALWYLDDELHATAPVYIRLDFGAVAYAPYITLTVAKNAAADGTLSSVLYTSVISGYGSGSAQTTTAQRAGLASAGPGYLALFPLLDGTGSASNAAAAFFAIERSRALDGTITNDAILVLCREGTNTAGTALWPTATAINYQSAAYIAGVPPVNFPYNVNGVVMAPGASLAAGGIGPVFPWVLLAPGVAPWQSCAICSVPTGDIPSGVFETSLCGAVADFYPLPAPTTERRGGVAIAPGMTGANPTSPANGSGALAIRWED